MNQRPDEHEIASRSYFIWVNEGKPEGRALDHWLRAKVELESEGPAPTDGGEPKPARRTAAKKSTGTAKAKKGKSGKSTTARA